MKYRRSLSTALAVAGLALVAPFLATSPAQADDVTSHSSRIQNGATHKCASVSVSDGVYDRYSRILDSHCNGKRYQRWTLVPAVEEDGYQWYQIVNVQSRQSIEVRRSSTRNNATVDQTRQGTHDNELWRLESVGHSNYVRIINRNSDLVLGIKSRYDNAPLVQQYWTGSRTQQWWLH